MKTGVRVIVGSESDFSMVNVALKVLKGCGTNYKVSVASVHRTIRKGFETELPKHIEERVILMSGGMSFQAAAILSSVYRSLSEFGHVIIAAPLDESAQDAIENLPAGTVLLTCGLNRKDPSHSLKNAALAAAQHNAIFAVLDGDPRPMMNFSQYMDTLNKDMRLEVELDEQGLLPLK